MTQQTLYIPHTFGAPKGSPQHRPWVATNARQAVEWTSPGQPAFTNVGDAFLWLRWARRQPDHEAEISIAQVNARTEFVAAGLIVAVVGTEQLLDPSGQVLRPLPGPSAVDARILAACYGLARVDAARTWLIDHMGARARVRITAALHATWSYGYRVAARDARTATASHVSEAVKSAKATATVNGVARGVSAPMFELGRVDEAAAMLGAAAALIIVPDPPPAVIKEAMNSFARAGELSGWDEALASVWKHALRGGALDSVFGVANDIAIIWRGAPRRIEPDQVRIGDVPAPEWLSATLLDANRTVATEWMLASEQPMPRNDFPRRSAQQATRLRELGRENLAAGHATDYLPPPDTPPPTPPGQSGRQR